MFVCVCVCVCAHVHMCARSVVYDSVTLWTNSPSCTVHEILQAVTNMEWLPFPSPRYLPDPEIEPASPCLLHWQKDSLPLSYLGSPISDI